MLMNYGFGLTANDVETQARLLLGYIGAEPVSDPRAVALLVTIPLGVDRITISQRAVELGANQIGIQKAYEAAYHQSPPTDVNVTTAPTPTIAVPFYKKRKFWAIASTILLVGGSVAGVLIWRRRSMAQ